MKSASAMGMVVFAVASSIAPGATLFLRNEANSGSEIFMLVCETVNVEIVLSLEVSETLGFSNVFFKELVTEGAENALEVTDFFPEEDALADASRDRSSMPAGNPYPNGAGIALQAPISSYAMILGPADVTGPLTVVLDNVSIHATALGTVEVSFEEGLRAPGVFDPSFAPFGLLPPGTDPVPMFLTLGLGDAREGGAGPLTIRVVEEVPAPPVENDNAAPADDNSGASNDNNGGGNGGGGGGGTSAGVCGLGMLGAFFCTGLSLPLLRRPRSVSSTEL